MSFILCSLLEDFVPLGSGCILGLKQGYKNDNDEILKTEQ